MALTVIQPSGLNQTATYTVGNMAVTANVTAGNIKSDHLLYANGDPYVFTTNAAGSNTQVQFNDGNSFAGNSNFTFNKVTGILNVTYLSGSGNGLSNITGANVTGQVSNSVVAGTVTTNAQPNITSVGTLTSLGVTGNIDVTGNFNVTGNLNYSNVTDLVVGDPLIYIGANNTGDLYDLGIVASYNDGSYVHTGIARNQSNDTWTFFDGVANEPTTVIDWANATYPNVKLGNLVSTANINASYFIGNGYALTNLVGANVSGAVSYATTANSVAGANVSGAVSYATTANSVNVANVSGIGNISTVNLDGNSSNVLYGNGSFAAPAGGGISTGKAIAMAIVFGF